MRCRVDGLPTVLRPRIDSHRDLRARYDRDGLVFPIEVLTPQEAGRYRAACDELEARLGGRPRTVDVRQMHLHFGWACELAMHPRILDAVEAVLGPDLLVWATELFTKHPQDTHIAIGWHRDRHYMEFAPETTITAWIALSESMPHNGCLRALPGPDRATIERDEDRAIDVDLRPGEMSLHDADVLHGSGPNRSDTKRVGFVIRYVTPQAQPPTGRPPVLLARGRDPGRRFCLVDRPNEPSLDAALAGMRSSAASHLDALLETLSRSDELP